MKAAERQIRLRQLFENRDFLDLGTLCRELDASESSIRRDLAVLEEQHLVRRVYGGAVSLQPQIDGRVLDGPLALDPFEEEKNRIARLTASLIRDGQTILLDGGSTVVAVARALAHKSLHVVTNSLPIAEELENNRNIELTLTGGYLDPRVRVMLGPFCEQMLGAIRADAVIMGIGAITEGGYYNNNTLVVGSEKKMIEVADRMIVVTDHTKFGRGGMSQVAPLEMADVVVTDQGLAPQYAALLRSKAIELHLA